MTAVEALKKQAEFAYSEVLEAIEGVTQAQAWAVLPHNGTAEYLHTDGSIQSLVLHVASCKFIYGSCGFRNSEIRWRDCAEEMDKFEPDWEGAKAYLQKAHDYWRSCWSDLSDEDLGREEYPNFRAKRVTAARLINIVTHHDGWHGGQIAVCRYVCGETDVPPPSWAEDIRRCCQDLPSW